MKSVWDSNPTEFFYLIYYLHATFLETGMIKILLNSLS